MKKDKTTIATLRHRAQVAREKEITLEAEREAYLKELKLELLPPREFCALKGIPFPEETPAEKQKREKSYKERVEQFRRDFKIV